MHILMVIIVQSFMTTDNYDFIFNHANIWIVFIFYKNIACFMGEKKVFTIYKIFKYFVKCHPYLLPNIL